METINELMEKAKAVGFDQTAYLDASTLTLLPEVRDMCAADRCRAYGRSWSCPPGCGSLEELSEKITKYRRGFLVQTIGKLEDDFDYEAMTETGVRHRDNLDRLTPLVLAAYPDAFPMAAGGCTRCEKCTYPDAPCRFPELVFPSMEACGLFVSDVCRKNNMKYNYGKLTISYTSCFLTD